MPDEIKGTDAVSASPDADSLFYLLKITGRAEIGNRDSDGTVKEFFDEDDIGVIQSTALLQDFNTDEFIEIPGSTNDKWLNGDSSTNPPWGGLNGGQLTITALGIPMSASWSVGATDRETELNAVNAIKAAYESPVPGFGVPFSDQQAWPFWGTQLREALSTSHNDFVLANNAAQLVAVFQGIIDGKSYVSFPGSNFKFVNSQSSNVIDALNKMYAPTLDGQKSVVDGISTLKDFFTVESFVETQINRTQNIFGPVFSSDTFWNEYQSLTNTTNLTSGVSQNFLLIQQITGQLSTGLSFTGLADTPTGFESGKFLVANETGLEWTDIEDPVLSFTGLSDTPTGYDDGKILQSTADGLEWVDMPAGGGGADSVDDITDLPDNPADGQLVAVGCDLYIGCNGQWVKVGANAIAPPTEAPACVSNLEEYNQYTEYKDQFLADNTSASFDAGLNNQTNIHDFIHDVCLFADSNLSQERNTVVIDETTYKWGMFARDQSINITAQAFSDPNIGSCTFKEWRSNLPGFPKTAAQETIFIDQDASITGFFECLVVPDQPTCSEIDFHLQASSGGTVEDKSDNNISIANPNSVPNESFIDNSEILFGESTFFFNDNKLFTFDPPHLLSDDFTIELWLKYNTAVTTSTKDIITRRGDLAGATAATEYSISLNQDKITIATSLGAHNTNIGMANTFNNWAHIAMVRHGNSLRLYVNGQQEIDVAINGSVLSQANDAEIGTRTFTGGWTNNPKHIQDFRISKKAVYTTNFTPPTKLLVNPC